MAGDPFVGTWKLNLAKSRFSPGPVPKSITITRRPGGKVDVREILPDGKELSWGYRSSGENPAPIAGMEGATISEKRPAKRTLEQTWNLKGSVIVGRGVLSKSGRWMTYTLKGTNPQGEPFSNVEVYEKR